MHGALILYTLIALFPVFVILINSFKTRKAIFREPLGPAGRRKLLDDRLPDGDEAGRFLPVLSRILDDRDGGCRCSFILLFGAMAAYALSEYRFKGNSADGAVSGARHHDPDPDRYRGNPRDDGGHRAGEHALGADPGLHGTRPAAWRCSSCPSSCGRFQTI